MSTNETSKSKKGIRRLLRNRFSRSSSHLPSSSTPSEPITASSPPEETHEARSSIQTSATLEIPPFNTERPSVAHSKAAPTPIGGEPANALSTTSDREITDPVWAGLQPSLQRLRDQSSVFPGLSIAVGMLLECFSGLAVAEKKQKDYKDLAKELMKLSDTLAESITGPTPPAMTKCISNVESKIQRQVEQIKTKSERAGGRLPMGKEDKEDMMNLSGNTWSIENEGLVNALLEALEPVKEATYDSDTSTVNWRKCTEGTRKQILSDLHNWISDDDMPMVYWMSGMEGNGKTTIAYTFSEQLEGRNQLAASFFCTRTSADCCKVTRIVPTIAYQLARYSIPFQSALYDILNKDPDAGSENIAKQYERLLRDPLLRVNDTIPDNLVIVIDALDECEDRNGVETLLDILFRYANDLRVRFFLTSRPEPEIYNRMMLDVKARAALHLHDIETSLVQADIEIYLIEELSFMSPTHSQIQQLAQRAGSLFIYAEILVRYIRFGKRFVEPHQRLHSILLMTPNSIKKHAEIDALYTAILQSALDETLMEQNEVEDVKLVLRTVLFAQEPIDVETIAALAGLDSAQRVCFALRPLRSVLHQSEDTKLVSMLHASFPDFIIISDRSKSFFCNIIDHSQQLAEQCLIVMKEQLEFNICKLVSSFVSDGKVDDLNERIERKISSALVYACRHWANHLELASGADTLLVMVNKFICERLLFWMEVLNLRREIASGVGILLTARKWLNQTVCASLKLAFLVEDACNFVIAFSGSPATQSTPHIYVSLLPFCPQSSTVYQNYWRRTRGLLQLKGSLRERREVAALATWNIGSSVQSVAYSPDGTQIAVGCKDKTVRILNGHDGTLLFDPLRGHSDSVRSVAFSPDGKLVASGSRDNTIRVWNTCNGNILTGPLEGHTHAVHSISFSRDGTRLFSGSLDGSICIWDFNSSTAIFGPWASPGGNLDSAALSPSNTLAACVSEGPSITLWGLPDMISVAPPLKGHTDIIRSIAFTPDGTRLISGADDGTVRVWNLASGSPNNVPFRGHKNLVYSVAVSPNGKRVASGSVDCTVRVWDIDDGSLVAGPLFGHAESVCSVTFSSDSTRVISGSEDGTIRVWNVRDGLLMPPTLYYQHMSKLTSASLSNNNTRMISGSTDDTIWVWDLAPGSITSAPLERHTPLPPCLPFSSTADRIAVFTHDHGVEILNANDGSLVTGPLHGHSNLPTSAGFSANSTHLVTGSRDRTVRIWDLKNAKPVAVPLYGHGSDVTSVSLSTDCSRVVSCSNRDRTIRVWNVQNPILNTAPSLDSSLSASPESDCGSVLEGANIQDDGWVTSSKGLLFWVPSDLTSIFAWPSPHTEFIITKLGILHIPEQELFLGDEWSRCYISD
ncbi:Kinesin-like protein KIF21B [Rhizoctonia solani]|uniref:Kinesin-like protein KIF21B n=1 Tax=Rhizoctonia solani TaxID=456999 RepID=A0A0K6GIH8_9AGAM|nr:Kinesin-like protein KIF21B [Rhizoctonia solani]